MFKSTKLFNKLVEQQDKLVEQRDKLLPCCQQLYRTQLALQQKHQHVPQQRQQHFLLQRFLLQQLSVKYHLCQSPCCPPINHGSIQPHQLLQLQLDRMSIICHCIQLQQPHHLDRITTVCHHYLQLHQLHLDKTIIMCHRRCLSTHLRS